VPLLGWIVLFTAFGGIASAALASVFLLLPERTTARMLPHFVSFATGALLGAALLALLPEAMESVGTAGAHGIGVALVAGLGIFFVIEKVVLWRHAHSHDGTAGNGHLAAVPAAAHGHAHEHGEGHGGPHVHTHVHAHPAAAAQGHVSAQAPASLSGRSHADVSGYAPNHDHGAGQGHDVAHVHLAASGAEPHVRVPRTGSSQDRPHAAEHGHDHSHRDAASGVLVLIGDSVHNVLDGILISAAFLQNKPLGLVTTFAVAAHEIPHRLGDFALLVHSGMSQRRALVLNMATGLAAVLGGIIAYFALQRMMGLLPYALALAAAGFLYIAVAGLIPALHRRADPRTSLTQVLLIGLGVGTIAWAESFVH